MLGRSLKVSCSGPVIGGGFFSISSPKSAVSGAPYLIRFHDTRQTIGAAGPKPSSRARLLLGVLGRTDNLQTALGLCQGCFFPEGRQNHLFAGIDASPLVKRETQHKTYTLHPSRKRERRRTIYGPASRRNVWSEDRFLFSQTHICKDLAWDGL